MKRFSLFFALATVIGGTAHALPNAPDIIPAKGGAIRITPIFHGSLQIEYLGQVIHVDPFSAGDYTGAKKADLVLITDIHADHLDSKALPKVMSHQWVTIIVPEEVRYRRDIQLLKGPFPNQNLTSLGVATLTLTNKKSRIEVKTIPMYNIKRGPKPGQKFHPKGRGNGYILTLGGKRIYIAGDTEVTPEMKALKNIDIAFLPMNLPFTMTPQEAATGARAFKPKIVYPYHYRYPFSKKNDNPQQFAKALAGSGIEVRLRGWYAHPAPQTKKP